MAVTAPARDGHGRGGVGGPLRRAARRSVPVSAGGSATRRSRASATSCWGSSWRATSMPRRSARSASPTPPTSCVLGVPARSRCPPADHPVQRRPTSPAGAPGERAGRRVRPRRRPPRRRRLPRPGARGRWYGRPGCSRPWPSRCRRCSSRTRGATRCSPTIAAGTRSSTIPSGSRSRAAGPCSRSRERWAATSS